MTYQHIKTQGHYDVMGKIRLQTDRPLLDMEELVLYRSRQDGSLWGRHGDEFFDPTRFRALSPMTLIGDKVTKSTGYLFPGEVRSVFFNKAGERRLVIEATGANYAGMLHIFSPHQLISVAGSPVGE